MKKIFLLLLMMLTMTGCGNEEKTAPKVGTLTQLNTLESSTNLNFYDNFNSMQMALKAKQLDAVRTYGSVAKYMTANDSGLVISEAQTVQLVDDFCCAMREDDNDLRGSFDTAIDGMKSDGTLDALIDKFINNITDTPQAVAIAKIDGADTIKVAVTGDLPPLDLVLADGTPAGFNTAVLSEISKRIGKNIELVQVDSSARAAALTSGQVDVIFWVVVPADDSGRPQDFDTPAGVTVTTPYYQDRVTHVHLSEVAAAF